MGLEVGGQVLVTEAELTGFCTTVLEKLKVPPHEAGRIARNLIEADLRGVGSHGVVRFPIYVQRIEDGGSNPAPQVSLARETRTTAVMDGDNGMGQIVGEYAMELAIEKARDGDCAFVSVRNSNHYGAAAYYVEMAARHDMIGLSFTIGGINHMTPWGGAEAMLGNNPFAIAFPTDRDFPVVLDMACSVAARGKIIVAAKDGTPIPGDWASDANGVPTTDAVEALKGFVLPIAGPKGYALTMTVGLLSSMLSGAAFGSEVTHMYEQTTTPQNVGHLFGVLPISSFEDVDIFKQRMGKAIEEMHGARRATGVDRIYVPGEREHLSLLSRRSSGIPLSMAVFAELKEVAERYQVNLEGAGYKEIAAQ
ncbi:Ldh family oxidoreductase [Aureimonas fodinaquatilis]|uniref:Ldh family oxidoreductase n=1 Tax=Aureimonas fodinaquatilis TaxID=2565783 RepID=A0A5B0DVM6_9HYPH|nr:Ldh family oxidoreductase [Aureimonas fodinaquatilis]KAA0969620.1 Ldh family oxidoreductase [Aureimonas fodinaquatilis]